MLEFLNSDDLLQYIKEFKFQRFSVNSSFEILDDYCITIKKGSTPLTLIEDYYATEEEKKLYHLMLIANYLKVPKITQEIQNSVLKNCLTYLSSYRENILDDLPNDAILSLYVATIFECNKNVELLNKVKEYTCFGIEYSQLFGKRFENEIYTTAMGRRRAELSCIYNGLELLSHLSHPVQEEIDSLFESWVSRYSIFQSRKTEFFERYPQFAELNTWPEDVLRAEKYYELSHPNLAQEKKEFFEILVYPQILIDLLTFLRTNPHLDIEKKEEETHYQKLLGCLVAEILKQMPKHENIRGDDIIYFFNKAYAPFLNHEGLFLKLLQKIEASYPSLFKQYQEAIFVVTKINYFDQFKEIEDCYRSKPIPVLIKGKKYDVELKSPYDSKEEIDSLGACTPKRLIQHARVDHVPRRYHLFSEIKPSSGVIQLLEQAQSTQVVLLPQEEESARPMRCVIS